MTGNMDGRVVVDPGTNGQPVGTHSEDSEPAPAVASGPDLGDSLRLQVLDHSLSVSDNLQGKHVSKSNINLRPNFITNGTAKS